MSFACCESTRGAAFGAAGAGHNRCPGAKGDGAVKKLLGWIAVAFVIYLVVRNPTGSAVTVRHMVAGVGHLASNFGVFLASLFSGRG